MPILEIAVIVLLTVFNGALAMSELAVVSSRRSRLEGMAAAGSKGAAVALALIDDPARFLATVQIGITLVGIAAGAFGGATLAGNLGALLDTVAFIAPHGQTVAIVVVVVAITYLSLIVGELVPKRIALADPERTAAAVARPMRALSWFAAPAVWLLRRSSDGILALLGLGGGRQSTVTEEEVKSLIAEGTRAGVFAPQEREMIAGVLRLADRTVRVVMTPRTDIVWLDVSAGREAIVERIEAGGHTRLLLCDGSVDEPIGFIDARDILARVLKGETLDLRAAARPMLAVDERTSVLSLIDLFRRRRVHAALIVDEYGTTEGLVTSTDILESIAGDLPEQEEDDLSDPKVVRRPDGSWLVDGRMPIDEFRDLVGIPGLGADGDFETVAGFVLAELRRLPAIGDRVERPDLVLEVVDMDGRRIDRIAVARTQ